jgi:hypothetical protein
LIRPPNGKLTPGKLLAAWRAGQTVVLWNSDPKDFAMPSSQNLREWFHTHPLAGGDIALFHDTWPYAAEMLTELVADARGRGLQFATPRRWLSKQTR